MEGEERPRSSSFLDGFDIIIDPSICQSATLIGNFEPPKKGANSHLILVNSCDSALSRHFSQDEEVVKS